MSPLIYMFSQKHRENHYFRNHSQKHLSEHDGESFNGIFLLLKKETKAQFVVFKKFLMF